MNTTKTNYTLPVVLMVTMLATIIWIAVIYPATTYKLDKKEYNAYLDKEPKDYKVRKDYTDLEWYGRQIYISEGCLYCHSQQARYQDRGMGPTAIPQEFAFDSPHVLGSERTGPDLSREGGKYPSRYHREHHINPRAKYAGSIMPSFRHLDEQKLEFAVPDEVDGAALLRENADELRRGMAERTGRMRPAVGVGDPNNLWTDRLLTPEEALYELRAIGYTDYDVKKPDGRGVTRLDALVAYIQSLGPDRLFEPGGPIPSLEPVPVAQDVGFTLGVAAKGATAAASSPAPAVPAATATNAAAAVGGALPQGVQPPPNWAGIANDRSAYWVPTEYQDLAIKAKEDGKIPAFEARFINNGRGVYMDKCVHCHGLNGQGNGPTARFMVKRPANFWLPQFKHYSDAMWFYRIAEGVPGTEMPVWKYSLRQPKEHQRWDQIWYLVAYLKYVAAASPIAELPHDLPPEYYLTNQELARRGMFPVDTDFITKYAEALTAAQNQAKAAEPDKEPKK